MIVILNPVAGRRRRRGLARVLAALAGAGCRAELVRTEHPGHATALARAAAWSGELVVAAGGDGTVAEVAAGLAGGTAALGIIPLGTANVLARELGLPRTPERVAAMLAAGRTRPLWPGLLRQPGGERLFVQMVGVGFDAQVVHRLSLPLKRTIGRGAYVAQTLREMVRPPGRVRLRLDNVEVESASAIVTKGRLYAGNFLLAPGADPHAPGFHVVLLDYGGAGGMILYGAALSLNRMPRAPGVRHLRATRIEVLTAGTPAQADGDAAGHTPLTILDAAAPLDVVVA